MTDQTSYPRGAAGNTVEPTSELAVESPPEIETTRITRLPALDGLRGIGALMVILTHILNTDPAFVRPQGGTLAWWLSYSPVNLLWDGDEALLMFFVLSGFVLTRPFTRKSQSYLAYYPRRLLRLYPPLWGALIFTFVLTVVESRHVVAGATAWTNSHTGFNASVFQDALLPRAGTTFDGPSWSLRWEILFSLFLPLYIVIGRSFTRSKATKFLVVVALLVLVAADVKVQSTQVSDAILYMPMFGVGVLMAYYEVGLVSWFRSFMGRSVWHRVGLFVVFIVLGDMTNEISPVKELFPGSFVTIAHGLGVVAAVLIILMVISWRPYNKVLEARPIDWLGKRSFSLYLLHEPILLTFAIWMGGHPNPLLLLVIVYPCSLLATAVFYRVVERPSHILSSRSGRAVQGWLKRRELAKAQPQASVAVAPSHVREVSTEPAVR